MLAFLKKLDLWFFKAIAGLCAALLGVMLLVIGLQIVMRYLFNMPLIWSEELARFVMVWLALLAAGLAMRRAQHIAMTGILPLPRRLVPVAKALAALATLAILGILAWHGLELAERTMRQRSPALSLPMGYMYAVIPVSCAIMMLGQVLAWITGTGPDDGAEQEEAEAALARADLAGPPPTSGH